MTERTSPSLALLASLLLPLSAAAHDVILYDRFSDGEHRQENLPESATWWGSTANLLSVEPGVSNSVVLQIGDGSNVRQAATFFTPVTLGVGESLVVTFDFTPATTIPVGVDNVLRVALVGEAPVQTADAQAPGVMSGYCVMVNASTNAARFRERNDTSAGILTSLGAWGTTVGTAKAPDPTFAWERRRAHAVTFRIERTSETSVRLYYLLSSAAGIHSWQYDDTTATATTFNALAFAIPADLDVGWFDNIRLVHEGVPTPTAVTVGTREVVTTKKTNLGTPVIPMWDMPMPHATAVAAGYPVAEGAQHITVWSATPELGGFNHHPALAYHDGRFYAMWSNHPQGEDAPGQRVLGAWSTDGVTWSPPQEVFPTPDEVKVRGQEGISLRPDRWVVVDGVLYAVSYCRSSVGSSVPIARPVSGPMVLGEPFILRSVPSIDRLPQYMRDVPNVLEVQPLADVIRQWYADNDTVTWWAQNEGLPREGVDRANLIEPFMYRAPDGRLTVMMRSHSTAASRELGRIERNNRMYVTHLREDGQWDAAYPTDIPDAPSRAEAVVLPTGAVVMIGNQIAPVFDTGLYLPRHTLTAAVSRDGYRFTRGVALRHSAPTTYRLQGIEGRTLGYGYPSSLIHNGALYSLYSVGKEDIAITRVPLASIVPNCLEEGEPTSWQRQYCDWLYANDLPRGAWDPTEDAVGTGISNLTRFALGIPPLEDGASRLPKLQWVDGPGGRQLHYVVPRNPAASAVDVRIETSRDLVSWGPAGADVSVISDTPERLEVRLSSLPEPDGALFVRTRLEISAIN